MRNWDNWLRYQDNDRNPLHGCIQFMVKDGNTVAPIYDSEGTALANPQVTDTYGRTQHQVFIDTDVIAYFYKYVGEGVWSQQDGIDTSDVSKWSLQYTSENTLDILLNITSDSLVSIGTITELRNVDVDSIPTVAGKKFVTLLGYFNSGDKEPINYYWNSESTEQDDGGSVIASENNITGRWIMVQPTEHVDSRHFGAFPSNSSNMSDQSYAITKLFNYCYTKGLRPFFNGSEDYRWFKYTNLDIIADCVDTTDFTYFNDNGTSTITGEWNGNPRFYNGNTNIVAENVKTSWNARSYTSYKDVDIDYNGNQKIWQNADVEIDLISVYNYSFINCEISENSNLVTGNTFQNCKLTEKMFKAGASIAGMCSGCVLDIEDFRNNMTLYKEWLCTDRGGDYFDFAGNNPGQKPLDYYAGSNKITANEITIKNLPYSAYTLDSINGTVTHYILEDCKGNFTLPLGVSLTVRNSVIGLTYEEGALLEIIDSSVTVIPVPNDEPEASIALNNSNLYGSTAMNFSLFNAKNSNISLPVISKNSTVINSVINGTFSLAPNYRTVGKTVTYNGSSVVVNYFIEGYFDSNIFHNTLIIDGHKAPTGVTNILVDTLTLQNNYSDAVTPWTINRLEGTMLSDMLNSYTYVNNTGKFDNYTSVENIPVIPGSAILTSNATLGVTLDNDIGAWYTATNISETEVEEYADDLSRYFTRMNLFVIGVTDAIVDFEIEVLPAATVTGNLVQLQPNVVWSTSNNFISAFTVPSKVEAKLSTFPKLNPEYLDTSHNFIISDLAKEGGNTEQWQIRNFNLGHTGLPFNDQKDYRINLGFRQKDKKF